MKFSIEPLTVLEPYKSGNHLWIPSQLPNTLEGSYNFSINDLFRSLGLQSRTHQLLSILEKINLLRRNSRQELALYQAGYSHHPASTYVRATLREKCTNNPSFLLIQSNILEKALKHPHITERDLESSPLKPLEKESINCLLDRIIGGCTSPKSKVTAIGELEAFTESVFANEELSHLRGGTLISFIKDFCFHIFEYAALSANTLRKVIKLRAPAMASRRGRSHPRDFDLLRDFVENTYGVKPIGI